MALLLAGGLALAAQDSQLTGFARTKELFQQGDREAVLKMAQHHTDKLEFKKAFELYLPFAQRGEAPYQQLVGSWLLGGKEYAAGGQKIQKDIQQGLTWLNLAAGQGDQKAMLSLGRCYRDGVGVTKDVAEAYKWFILCRTGTDKLTEALAGLSEKESLAKTISVEEAREGQRRADAFKAGPKGQAQPIRPDFLKLELISGSSKEPVAMINGTRFTPGATKPLVRLGQPVQVQCVEITRHSAFVTFPPATQRFELRL